MSVFIPTPAYPDAPFAPGVPVMPRAFDALVGVGSIALLVEDLFGIFDSGADWGIFDDDGNSVVPHDSVAAFDFRAEYAISDYPVERGGFQSYDKVTLPFDVRFRFTTFGAQAVRADFLDTLAIAATSLKLYTATTPDALYPSANIVHYDYHRETRNGGVGMIVVDVWLREVRETGTTQFASESVVDTGQWTVEGGTKQATDKPLPVPPAFVPDPNGAVTPSTLKVTVPSSGSEHYRADIPNFAVHTQQPALAIGSMGGQAVPSSLNTNGLLAPRPNIQGP